MTKNKNTKPTPKMAPKKVVAVKTKASALKTKIKPKVETKISKPISKLKTKVQPIPIKKSPKKEGPKTKTMDKPTSKILSEPKPVVQKAAKTVPEVKKFTSISANVKAKDYKPLASNLSGSRPSRRRRRKVDNSKLIKKNHKTFTPATPIVATVKGKISPILEIKKKVFNSTTNSGDSPTTNGKTRYTDKELLEFKALIDEKLTAARQELNYLQEQIVEMNENNSDIQGSDWFDDSSIHAEVELLNNMAIRQRQFIQNLENALVRIENKTYGICIVTGTLIEKKRLLLVPHATKSIEAKHIELATMVPDINQVAPDERVLRRTAEGKSGSANKKGLKKSKSKATRDFEEEDSEETTEAPVEELDMRFEGGDD